MNSKRSYLDSLNAGRQRRPNVSLEDLDRTLENFEDPQDYPPSHADLEPRERPSRSRRPQDGEPGPTRRDTREAYHEGMRSRMRPPSFTTLARDMERTRAQEDSVAAASRIAAELKAMREEIRQQVTSGLKREFEALRKDIHRAYQAVGSGRGGEDISRELERLSGAIHDLAARSDDRNVQLLRLELEEVKTAVHRLAREDTVQSFGSRFDAFEQRMAGEQGVPDPAIAALGQRLEQIGAAVNGLPESLSLRSLEDKVRMLAGAVEQFAGDGGGSAAAFGMIEERLDEISRAIAASAVVVQPQSFDPEPLERIDARMSLLARQIEELAEDRSAAGLADQLTTLSRRIDEIAVQATMPEEAVQRLGSQIALIAEKLDMAPETPDAAVFLDGLDERFIAFSDMLDRRQGDAIEHGNALLHDLERRLDEVNDRLERRSVDQGDDRTAIMDTIDARFAELAARLETRDPPHDDGAIRNLETRLDAIAEQLHARGNGLSAIDSDVISNLEAQVAGLSAHLAEPGRQLPEFEDLGPRLDQIERSIAGNRETLVRAARAAAEEAVRDLGLSTPESDAVADLAGDLRSLEELSRKADERNTKTFEAIHDTLLKIVDRLGTIDTGDGDGRVREGGSGRQAATVTLAGTPSIETDPEMAVLDGPDMPLPPGERETALSGRTPADAAAAAAAAALGRGEGEEAGKRSLLGGITRALSGRRERKPAAERREPEVVSAADDAGLDEPLDPKLANQPLEPGSGAPDLNAIIKRVRDERGQPLRSGEAAAAKSDFIAAARRAAQAAAAEADVKKRSSEAMGPSGRFKLGGLFRRKPVLLATAAVLVALAGLQLGQAFFSPRGGDVPEQVASAGTRTQAPTADTQTEATDLAAAAFGGDMLGEEPAVEAFEEETIGLEETAVPTIREIGPGSMPAGRDEAPAREAATMPEDPFPAEELSIAFPPAPLEAGPVALREAADGGDPKAIFEIGSRYSEGRGTEADLAEAAQWYERAAELGFAPAQYRIGNFYEKGLGVERDIDEAKTWYQLAAAQGNASAMHNLAVLFAMGADGTTDNESAARWFIEAAELGIKDSQFNLGILSAKGVGMPQDLEEAYKWFALVARDGDKDAAEKRDEIANALRPEQLARARATTELWRARPVIPEANIVEVPDAWTEGGDTTAGIDMRQAIRNIQAILNKNGYDAGPADGMMGARTRAAIVKFQGDNGMPATGEVDDILVRALLERR